MSITYPHMKISYGVMSGDQAGHRRTGASSPAACAIRCCGRTRLSKPLTLRCKGVSRWNRINRVVETISPDLLQRVCQEFDYRIDVCQITKGAHIEALWWMHTIFGQLSFWLTDVIIVHGKKFEHLYLVSWLTVAAVGVLPHCNTRNTGTLPIT
jgi:hypothetical protein